MKGLIKENLNKFIEINQSLQNYPWEFSLTELIDIFIEDYVSL